MVGRSTKTLVAVKAYHVRFPFLVVLVHENRGVTVHHTHIGVVLHTEHIDSLTQGGTQMPRSTEV